jgi:predicted dehydrogenase
MTQRETTTIRVGIIGAGWMGHVHARAFARLNHHFPDLGVRPQVVAVADSVPGQLADFAARHGVETRYADWRDLVADPSIDVVSVTAPNFLHAEMGSAVAQAGKHLWIEKPVGLTAADARAVDEAVAAAGVVGCVGFNYRNVPAVTKAKELIESGAIGRPTHARVSLLTDYAAHPAGPLSWRYERGKGGHGVLGDLASHAIDLTRFLLGDLDRLVAVTDTFIPKRPIVDAGSSHYAVVDLDDPSITMGDVENEDYVSALMVTVRGVAVTMESSRAAVGEQNAYVFEVHGTKGLVRWDFRKPGQLDASTGEDYSGQPSAVAYSAPGDGEYLRFQPGSGIAMGYDDSKVIEAAYLLDAIVNGGQRQPTLGDAVHSAVALEAIVESVSTGAWVSARP